MTISCGGCLSFFLLFRFQLFFYSLPCFFSPPSFKTLICPILCFRWSIIWWSSSVVQWVRPWATYNAGIQYHHGFMSALLPFWSRLSQTTWKKQEDCLNLWVPAIIVEDPDKTPGFIHQGNKSANRWSLRLFLLAMTLKINKWGLQVLASNMGAGFSTGCSAY